MLHFRSRSWVGLEMYIYSLGLQTLKTAFMIIVHLLLEQLNQSTAYCRNRSPVAGWEAMDRSVANSTV